MAERERELPARGPNERELTEPPRTESAKRRAGRRARELVRLAESRERELAELAESRERELVERAESREHDLAELTERERELAELAENRGRELAELAERARRAAELAENRQRELAELTDKHQSDLRRLEELNSRLREEVEQLRAAPVEPDEPAQVVPTSHLVFVQLDERYELISRDGPPPAPSTPLSLPDVDELLSRRRRSAQLAATGRRSPVRVRPPRLSL